MATLSQSKRTAAQIPRPGAPMAAARAGGETIDEPLSVISDALITGTISWWEIEAAAAVFAEAGALGAFGTVALVGSVMTGAGAIVLLTAGVAAVFSTGVRSQLQGAKKLIGVATSPGGLTVLTGMEATGYTTKESLDAAEFGKAVFSGYSAYRAIGEGIKNSKDAASFLNNIKDVVDYGSDRILSQDAPSDNQEPDNESGDYGPPSLKEFLSSGYFDKNGQWVFESRTELPGSGNISDGSNDDGGAHDSPSGGRPGGGQSNTGSGGGDEMSDGPGGGEIGDGGGGGEGGGGGDWGD